MLVADYKLPAFKQTASPDLLNPYDRLDDLDSLIDVVDVADQGGVFQTLPERASEVRAQEVLASRRKSAWTRLFVLGYLTNEYEEVIVREKKKRLELQANFDKRKRAAEKKRDEQLAALRKAIEKFQKDAGLTVDGWIGNQTWNALEELVSFEAPVNLSRWMKMGPVSRNPVLRRAIRGRLRVFGFFEGKGGSDSATVLQELEKFREIAVLIGRSVPLTPLSRFDTSTLLALFDQDGISACLATLNNGIVPVIKPKDKGKIARFMIQNAKIELWLHGYDVEPDTEVHGLNIRKGDIDTFNFKEGEQALFNAMVTHLHNLGYKKTRAEKLIKTCEHANLLIDGFQWLFGNLFFKETEAKRAGTVQETPSSTKRNTVFDDEPKPLLQGDTPISDDTGSDILYDTIEKLDRKSQNNIWESVKNLGSRIWDGIKRVWRFFKLVFKKVAEKVTGWIKNLARMAVKFATEVFSLVKTVVHSVKYILPQTVPDSQPLQATIQRARGFDYNVFVHQTANPHKVEHTLATLQQHAFVFKTGLNFLVLIVQSIIKTVKRIVIGSGWFQFIMSLVKVYREFRNLRPVLVENRYV